MAVSNVELRVDARNALSGLRQVNRASSQLDGAINQLQRSLGGLAASFAGGFALSKIIQDVTELDRNLRRLGTVGGNIKELDKGLGALSQRLDGVANKAELAAASYQALSAGFTDTAGNLKLVEAATKAAVGGLADTTQVTEVLTKTLNAYGMSGEQAVKVTDSISKAIEYGQVQWSDYTSQLGRVASIAALAGVSLDEVNAFVAAATKNGATAEVAFTGLSAALTQILQPTKESQDAAKLLGIQWNLAGIQSKGFTGLMAELAKAQNTNKEAAARLIGSQEGMRGVFAANAKAGKDYQMILQGLQGAAGKTDSDFNQMKVSLENQLKALDTAFKNLSEALGIAFGPAVIDSVGDLTGLINGFVAAIKAIPQPVVNATVELVKIVAQMILLQKAMQGIIALRAAFIGTLTASAAATAATGAAATGSASAFALYTNNTKALAAASAASTAKLAALRGMLMSIASIGVITVAVNVAIYGIQELQRVQAELDRLRGKKPGQIPASGVFPGETREGLRARQAKQMQQIPLLQQKIRQQKTIVAAMPAGTGTLARKELAILEGRLAEARRTVAADPNALPSAQTRRTAGGAAPTAAITAAAGGGGAGGGGGAKQAKAIKDITGQELELRLRLGMAQQSQNKTQEAFYTRQLALLDISQQEIGPNQRKALIYETMVRYADTMKQIHEEEARVTLPAIVDRIADMASGFRQVLDLTPQLTEQQKQQKALADGIAGTVGDGMTSAFNALIQGSDNFGASLQRIASGVLIDIANQLLRVFVIQKAINAISNIFSPKPTSALSGVSFNPAAFSMPLLTARAMGGSVTAGKPYLVGEKGPELFMPGRSGGIAPTGSFGGGVSVVVNVDASGTSVSGNEPDAAQLGRAVSVAVQAEIIKQQRPGGLLSTTRR